MEQSLSIKISQYSIIPPFLMVLKGFVFNCFSVKLTFLPDFEISNSSMKKYCPKQF